MFPVLISVRAKKTLIHNSRCPSRTGRTVSQCRAQTSPLAVPYATSKGCRGGGEASYFAPCATSVLQMAARSGPHNVTTNNAVIFLPSGSSVLFENFGTPPPQPLGRIRHLPAAKRPIATCIQQKTHPDINPCLGHDSNSRAQCLSRCTAMGTPNFINRTYSRDSVTY
jgi:hypothetical protein